MKKWILKENDANISLMAETLKLKPALCHILANRGIRSKNAVIKFLNPLMKFLNPIEEMLGVKGTCEIIKQAIEKGEKICIFGDYDVDGVCSTVILFKTLKSLGADCEYYIPHREKEGYGLNIAAIEDIASRCQIIMAVDNGISAIEEVKRAVELGLTVVIIDHHQTPAQEIDGSWQETLPQAHAIINPKQHACPYPFKEMSAAGIVYRFCKHLYEFFGKPFDIDEEALIFATISTFCDVVDLVDDNRIIAKNGMRLLGQQKVTNIGLDTLIKARNIECDDIDDFAIGFILGPCINASGRLDSAALAVELFLTEDEAEAAHLAERLVMLNEQRKDLCAKHVDDAIASLDIEDLDDIIVLYIPHIHESIAGIVAGRIKEHTGHPTIVFSKAGEVAKGSARSIEAYNIFEEMQKNKDLLDRFGGHKMAAGATLAIENIDILRQRLNHASTLKQEDFVPIISGEKELSLDDITFELASDIDALAPFGKGNREPVFFTKSIFTERIEIIGQSGQTLRFIFRSDNGRKITAIAFKATDKFVSFLQEKYSDEIVEGFASGRHKSLNIKMDLAYNIRINHYKGNASLQLVILDFKHP
ncbi:MAG: single-stranded-DNA-specific exonuclease RecJ [Defluviitaleaceae bacterium]|nr:single-stranded-DNA-specific exonuclease RecJ [Defluviitaleaceae bacterium]